MSKRRDLVVRSAKRSKGGATLIEFSLIAIVLFLLVFGAVDFGRAIQSYSTIADAVRQAARQAAANDTEAAAAAFGSTTGSCSGTTTTSNVNGTGCLSDQAIFNTVTSVLSNAVPTANVTLEPSGSYTAATCPTPTSGGNANVCITPAQTTNGTGAVPANCAGGVWTTSPYPYSSLISRLDEFSNNTYKGCYLVQVSIVYSFQPLVGSFTGTFPSLTLRASTATVAEY